MPDNTGPTQHSLPMFAPSEPTNSEPQMSFLAGSHVKISASPGKALALLVNNLVYGTSSDGLLARFDPDSCSWRTFQLSLFGEEPKSLDILPRWGMTRGGELWQRPTPERPTSAAVGGAWVTATASDTISVRTPESMAAHFAKHRPGRTTPPSLREHVQYGNNRSDLGLNGHVQYHGQPTGAYLNPEWVEMLMGYPAGYTELED